MSHLDVQSLPASAVLFVCLPSASLLNMFPAPSASESYLSSSASLVLFVLAQYAPV